MLGTNGAADGSAATGLDAIKSELSLVQQAAIEKVDEAKSFAEGARAKAEGIAEEHKKLLGEHTELAKKFAEASAETEVLKKQVDNLIKQQNEAPHNEREKLDAVRKSALDFYEFRHHEAQSENSHGEYVPFNEKSVTDDMIAGHELAEKTMNKIMRMDATVRDERRELSDEEMKAMNHFFAKKSMNTGDANMYWMPPQMGTRIIRCIEERTSMMDRFSVLDMSGQKLILPRMDDVQENKARWRCEINCDPNVIKFVVPGTLSFETEELYGQYCLSHHLIEDAVVDVAGWMADEFGKSVSDTLNRAFMTGNQQDQVTGEPTEGLIQGLLNCIKTVPFKNPEDVGLDDLLQMPYLIYSQFRPNARFYVSDSAMAYLVTKKDANGQYLLRNVTEGGVPTIGGYPVETIYYVPEFSNEETGTINVGSKAVIFGDLKEAYLVVRRLGMTLERDPYSGQPCGIVYRTRMRIGGGCICPNAAIAGVVQ